MVTTDKKIRIMIRIFFINIIFAYILADILINFFDHINTFAIFINGNFFAKS